jgi:SAM-dependent methyltransferase
MSRRYRRSARLKLCLACRETFEAADWACPACGWAPARIDGFMAFAPELAEGDDGFAAEAHAVLDGLQAENFWFRARSRLIADLIAKHAPDASRVLEVGCGTGFVLEGLRAALPYARISGSEIETLGLGFAAKRVGGAVELFQMDARRIPFVEEFDLVCAFDVLEHIDEDVGALSEIARSLKPGGWALLSVPQHPFLWSRADEYGHHKRRYRRGELAAKCEAKGLRIVMQTSFVSLLLPLMAAQRLVASRGPYDPRRELALPAPVNRTLERLLDLERAAIRAGVRLPIGGSRFVLAQRDDTSNARN